MKLTLEDVVAAEDKVVVRVTGRGTHRGSLLGETPTGKSITVCGVVSLLQQLGVLPQNLGVQRDDKKHLPPPGDAQNAEAMSSQMWRGGSGGRVALTVSQYHGEKGQ